MNRIESESASQWRRDVYGIASLAIAALLIAAAANGLSGHYQALRVVVCGFSVVAAHFAYHADKKGWLIFAVVCATLFNPIYPVGLNRDWPFADCIFAFGYVIHGLSFMNKRLGRGTSILVLVVCVSALGMTFYVNHNMPHGPSYPTGDVVCENDGRGPCGPEYKEDMRDLNIPDWAKALRESFIVVFLFAAIPVVYLNSSWNEEDEFDSFLNDPDFVGASLLRSTNASNPMADAFSESEPIQRAAKTLAKCASDRNEDAWLAYVPAVRTVIEALEDPTASMIDAGNEAMRRAWIARGLLAPSVAGDAAVSAAWEAMIDRLLGHA
jgi:hypothetical protein